MEPLSTTATTSKTSGRSLSGISNSELSRLADWIMSTSCGYCLDGRDTGAAVCPECGAKSRSWGYKVESE